MGRRTIVVGGGLAGLAAAARLADAGADVALFERADAVGGVAGTVAKSGFRFERGPNTILAGSAAFRRVVDELGLSTRLERADPTAKARYLWHRGKLRALPMSPPQLLSTDLLSWKAKRELLSEPFRGFVPPQDGEPEPTFGAFLDERLGRETSRLFAGAFVRGIHAAELDELGARSAFPRLWDLAASHGSLVRGALSRVFAEKESLPGPELPRSALVSFPNGLQELVDAFARQLGGRIRNGAGVEGLERIDARWLVRTRDGLGHVADDVVLTLPAPAAARILAHELSPEDLAALRAVRHASVTTIGLGFAPGALEALPRGFGYLVPPAEDGRTAPAPRALGTIFVTNLFPNRAPGGARSVASFYRGSDVDGLDDSALASLARQDLELAIGSSVPPAVAVHVERWTEVIPRHSPGHADRVRHVRAALRQRAPGLHLAGAWVGGVSVEQVLTSGRAAADDVLRGGEERT
ncbi:MAG: protoporphyrinogen oxidase [Planctomycetota bacterium]|nr:protoporphyrinogen oxidase [Planctomycetota bacterium]